MNHDHDDKMIKSQLFHHQPQLQLLSYLALERSQGYPWFSGKLILLQILQIYFWKYVYEKKFRILLFDELELENIANELCRRILQIYFWQKVFPQLCWIEMRRRQRGQSTGYRPPSIFSQLPISWEIQANQIKLVFVKKSEKLKYFIF